MSDTINRFIWRRKKEQIDFASGEREHWLMSECVREKEKRKKRKGGGGLFKGLLRYLPLAWPCLC